MAPAPKTPLLGEMTSMERMGLVSEMDGLEEICDLQVIPREIDGR